MLKPSKPADEASRLAALHELELLDTPAEARFERLTRLAKTYFQVPMVWVSLIDDERQWFKSKQGLDVCETSRDISFCGHAILQDQVLHVSDALQDERFFDNPLVTGAPFIRFYAGMPLAVGGFRIGTLCLLDQQPRTLNDEQLAFLRDLAGAVEEELRRGDLLRAQFEVAKKNQILRGHLMNTPLGAISWDRDFRVISWNRAAENIFGFSAQEALGKHATELIVSHAEAHAAVEGVFARLLTAAGGERSRNKNLTKSGRQIICEWYNTPVTDAQGVVLEVVSLVEDITSELETEAALAASERRFRDIAEIASDWFWELDAELRFQYLSDSFARVSGADPKDLLGKTRWEVASIGDSEEERQRWQAHRQVMENHQEFRDFQYQKKSASGTLQTYSVSGKPIYDANGQFCGYRGVAKDITQALQAQQAARMAEEILQQSLNSLNEAFVIYDDKDRLLMCNQRYRELFPISSSVIVPGSTFESIIRYGAERGEFPDAIGRVDKWVAHRLAVHQQDNGVLTQELANGRILRIVESKTSNGYTVGFRLDVTDVVRARRDAERATREARMLLARLQAIHEILPVGLEITDSEGLVTDRNPAAVRLLGIPAVTQAGRQQNAVKWDVRREDGSVIRSDELPSARALREHRTIHDQLMQVHRTDRTVWLSVSAMPVESRELGAVVAYVDVTEAREQQKALLQAKQAAEKANSSKSQFLANMSHEIRTPMNAIIGMLDLLKETALDSVQREYVEQTTGAARALLGILNDILDFSKVEAGKMTLEQSAFPVSTLLNELAVIFTSSYAKPGVEILFDIDPAMPEMLVGDSLRLKQVLINLGGNALKFTGQGMVVLRIKVEGRTEAGVQLEFSVIDTGIGIAPQHLQQVFEGFSQAEASTSRRFGGTGLGLAISAKLVSLMGGHLAVESEVDLGSRFYFRITLPVSDVNTLDAADEQKSERKDLEVLVIDDNPTAQRVLQGMAQAEGWRTEVAQSGTIALDMVRHRIASQKKPYDLIFLDAQMPQMDGWTTAQQIKAQLTGLETSRLIMTSSLGRDSLAKQTASNQALLHGYLVKPITPVAMRKAALQALDGDKAAAAALPKQQRLVGMRVLVAEDNKVNQIVARKLLEREGAVVTLVDDGAAAVNLITANPAAWQAVLMDVQMPVLDGYAATRTLRQQHGLTTLPIVAMTANAMESDRQDALAAGMNAHVSKPFSLDDLVAVLCEQTGKKPV